MNKLVLLFLFSISIASNDTLLFVYNAKNDTKSVLKDFFHKTFNPKTYPCNLCKITYNTFNMKREWRAYLKKELSIPYQFKYLNENESFLNDKDKFPAILIKSNDKTRVLINKEKLNSITSLDILIAELKMALNN